MNVAVRISRYSLASVHELDAGTLVLEWRSREAPPAAILAPPRPRRSQDRSFPADRPRADPLTRWATDLASAARAASNAWSRRDAMKLDARWPLGRALLHHRPLPLSVKFKRAEFRAIKVPATQHECFFTPPTPPMSADSVNCYTDFCTEENCEQKQIPICACAAAGVPNTLGSCAKRAAKMPGV